MGHITNVYRGNERNILTFHAGYCIIIVSVKQLLAQVKIMNGNYFPVDVERSEKKPPPEKTNKLSQSQILLIAIIILAMILLAAVTVFIIDKILNPGLIKILVEPSLEYDHVYYCGEGLFAALINFDSPDEEIKAGLIDKYGNIILPAVYNYIGYFDGGVADIGQDGKCGLINKNREFIVPLIYDNIGNFYEGLAAAGIDGKRGYIDRAGNIIIDLIYESAYGFSEGLAAVYKDGKYGFINTSGETVVPFIYDCINDQSDFKNGLSIVGRNEISEEKENNIKWGVIDKAGNIVVPFEYDYISYRSGGIIVYKDGKTGIINKNGGVIFFDLFESEFPEYNLEYFGDDLMLAKKDGKCGCMNMSGEIVIDLIYDDIHRFDDGLFTAKKDGMWGLIETTGEVVIPFEYYRIMNIENELIIARKSFINSEGSVYVKMGYINKNNEEVLPFIYDNVGYFENGLARVSNNGKWGLINEAGEIVIPLIYYSIDEIGEQIITARKGEKSGLINRKGDIILPFEYDKIRSDENENILLINKGGLWGIAEIKK